MSSENLLGSDYKESEQKSILVFPHGSFVDYELKKSARPAVILVEGPLDPSKIVLEPTLERIKTTPDLERHIEAVWDEAERNYKKRHPGKEFRNGSKVLVRDVHMNEGGDVIIRTGISDYKERIATIKPEYQVARKFGPEFVAAQLATSSIILTSDDQICLCVLGLKTEEKNRIGSIHTIAGLLEMNDDKTPVGLIPNIKKEISEELGFGPGETNMHFSINNMLGVIQDPSIFATDVIFEVETDFTKDEILARREQSDKEVDLFFIQDDAEEIEYTILVFAKTGTATALTGLYLYGKNEFGDDWSKLVQRNLSYAY
jgi:hypothetical protein